MGRTSSARAVLERPGAEEARGVAARALHPPPRHAADRAILAYLILYAVFAAATLHFYPSYSWPHGDEGTYYSFARSPWTLIGDYFEGLRVKEVMSPYAFRLFLNPMSLAFAIFGFTPLAGRACALVYGLGLLAASYALARQIASPWRAFAVTVLLSLTPSLLYFTHGVRPEGLMAALWATCLWLVLRDDDLRPRTWFLVAMVSAAAIFVHYNGVVMAPIFGVALLVHDRRALTRRKLAAFLVGGACVLAVFLAVDFLPALSAVREFGVMPVTFVSSNRIPLWNEGLRSVVTSARAYSGFVTHGAFFDQSLRYTAWLAIPALVALVWRRDRRASFIGLVAGLLALAFLFVFPERNNEYLLYWFVPLFGLTAAAWERLPRRAPAQLLAIGLLTLLGMRYVVEDVRSLRRHYGYHESNVPLMHELRRVVEAIGDPREVTVMGCQEFHVAVPEARFRTFHSVGQTGSVKEAIRQRAPDVVVVHQRSTLVVSLMLWGSGRRPMSQELAGRELGRALDELGYRRHETADPLTWNDGGVMIFVRDGRT